MKKYILLSCAIIGMAHLSSAQNYCQPSSTNPAWSHALSQGLHSFEAKVNGSSVLTDGPQVSAYNWVHNTKKFDVKPGDQLTIHVTTQMWAWDIVVAFDWDIDGSFETVYRAFDNPETPAIEKAESFFKDTPGWGTSGNTFKEWTFIVPESAKAGFSHMRVLVDGDGYANGGTPPFSLCGSIGYAGSMHDYGITVAASTGMKNVVDVNAPRVYFKGAMLCVDNIASGNVISVYNISGAMLVNKIAQGSSLQHSLPSVKGVHIVKVQNLDRTFTVKVTKLN